jgi:ABC-2 type transport system ATP-binding protein
VADLAVQTAGLTKRFGSQTVVDRLDLAVPTGAVYGFLGPNGSGKTTSLRLLLGLANADAGTATVLGHEVPRGLADALPAVGALVEGPAFYPFLSGAANLARLDAADRTTDPSTRPERVEAALHRVGLSAATGKKAKAYSLGMKQRLGIAGALLRPRDLLVLDEPTNGLDPQGTREVRMLVRSLAEDGTTVLVSSHLLAEVEQICSHVGVMSRGRLVAQGTLADFRAEAGLGVSVRTPDEDAAGGVLAAMGLAEVRRAPGTGAPRGSGPHDGHVLARLDATAPEAVVAALVAAGVRVRGFEVTTTSLEERFVSLTGEGFDVAG